MRLRRLLRVYPALLRVAWETALEYRAQAILWILSGVFPLVMLVVWLALVEEAGPITGWTGQDFIAYYIGAAIVSELTFSWAVWQWDEDIRLGTLSVKLLKPLDPFHHLMSEQLGWKIFFLLFVVPLAAIFVWWSPLVDYPISLGMLLAFFMALVGGFLVSILMASAFGMISFWSTQTANLYSLWYGAGQFLAGWIAPLALFPESLRRIANWLPFRTILGFPVEILTGQLTWPEIWFGFVVTTGWSLIFMFAYRLLWRNGLRRYEAVGA